MISKSKKFIFVEVYRVASRSLSQVFYEYKFNRNLFHKGINKLFIPNNKTIPYFSKLPLKHDEAFVYQDYLGRFYKNYFTFAFVRNPFDWQVSLFFWIKSQKKHPQYKIIKDMNFNEYIQWRCSKDLRLQKNYLVDKKDNVIVDFIGRYENLNHDYKLVSQKLNINAELPHLNSTKHKHYGEYYNKTSIQLMQKFFEEDFQFLNYSNNI